MRPKFISKIATWVKFEKHWIKLQLTLMTLRYMYSGLWKNVIVFLVEIHVYTCSLVWRAFCYDILGWFSLYFFGGVVWCTVCYNILPQFTVLFFLALFCFFVCSVTFGFFFVFCGLCVKCSLSLAVVWCCLTFACFVLFACVVFCGLCVVVITWAVLFHLFLSVTYFMCVFFVVCVL